MSRTSGYLVERKFRKARELKNKKTFFLQYEGALVKQPQYERKILRNEKKEGNKKNNLRI